MDPTSEESFRSFLPGSQQEDDKALIVRFYVDKKLLGLKSHEAGRPVYEDREYCEIRIKGQPKQVVVEEVSPKIKARFPIAYFAFQQNREAPLIGTPIEQLPGVGPSMAATLKTFGIRTVEDMANLNEIGLQNVGGGSRELQKRSKAWLSQSSEKNVSLEQENATLKAQLDEQARQIAAIQAQLKPRAPRKPKPAPVVTQ